jgi:hypothetical protein
VLGLGYPTGPGVDGSVPSSVAPLEWSGASTTLSKRRACGIASSQVPFRCELVSSNLALDVAIVA